MSAGDGDGWVTLPDGSRRWGRYGAAGMLLYAPGMATSGHVLMQRRSWWSHQGGTWGLPGGALDSDESPVEAARREFGEEVAGDPGTMTLVGVHRQEYAVWRYDTVLARVATMRTLTPANFESSAIRWVRSDEVAGMRLLPAFAEIWPWAREALTRRLVLVVDAPSVVAAAGASTLPLRDDLATLATTGLDGAALPAGLALPALRTWFPRVLLRVEAGAGAPAPVPGVEVLAGDGPGFAELVRRHGDEQGVLAVTGRPDLLDPHDQGRVVDPGWLLSNARLGRSTRPG